MTVDRASGARRGAVRSRRRRQRPLAGSGGTITKQSQGAGCRPATIQGARGPRGCWARKLLLARDRDELEQQIVPSSHTERLKEKSEHSENAVTW